MSHCFVIGPFQFSMAEVGGRERWFLQGLLYQAKIEKANSFIQSFAWASVSSHEVSHACEGSIGSNTERNPSNAWYILSCPLFVCVSVPVCVKHKNLHIFAWLKVNREMIWVMTLMCHFSCYAISFLLHSKLHVQQQGTYCVLLKRSKVILHFVKIKK